MRSSLARLEQFKDNQGHARFLLNQTESVVSHLGNAMIEVQEKLVAAGNGAYGDQRAGARSPAICRACSIAWSAWPTVPMAPAAICSPAVAKAHAPFAQNGTVVSFSGDALLQRIEVANDRLLQVKFSGDDLLLKIRSGNGTFTTAANAGNTGSANIDAGAVDQSVAADRQRLHDRL